MDKYDPLHIDEGERLVLVLMAKELQKTDLNELYGASLKQLTAEGWKCSS